MFLYASIARSAVLDLVGVDLRDGAVELDLRLALERRGDVPLVGVDEVEPLPELPVVALELEVGLLVVRVDLEDLLEPLAAARSALRKCSSWSVARCMSTSIFSRSVVTTSSCCSRTATRSGHCSRTLVDARRGRGGPGGSSRRRRRPRGTPAPRATRRPGSSRRAARCAAWWSAISAASRERRDLAQQDVDELAVLARAPRRCARGSRAPGGSARPPRARAGSSAIGLVGLLHLRVEQLAEVVEDLLAVDVVRSRRRGRA